ncbi:MAG: hypothetical protein HGN29_05030 [Asgard group archaeon]|nr:hypothetical protein [Asgard group archaeon]
MHKKKLIRNIENLSNTDLIEFFRTQFEISEENIILLSNLELSIKVTPLLYLLNRIGAENHSGKIEYLTRQTIDKQKGVSKSLEQFIDELLSAGKFGDGSAKQLLEDISYGLSLYSKSGNEWLVDVLLNAMEKSNDELLAIISIDLIKKIIHFLEYEPFLKAIEKSENRYVKLKALGNIRRIGKGNDILDPEVNIRIINGIKGELENSDEEIRWEASKTVSTWLEGLKLYKIREEKLEEMGLEGREEIERRILEIGYEFSKGVIEYFEREGTIKEKKMIGEFKEKKASKEYRKIALEELEREPVKIRERARELIEKGIITEEESKGKFSVEETIKHSERYLIEDILENLEEIEVSIETKKELEEFDEIKETKELLEKQKESIRKNKEERDTEQEIARKILMKDLIVLEDKHIIKKLEEVEILLEKKKELEVGEKTENF